MGQFDYIHAEDVAEALFRLAEVQATGVVNVGSGQATRVGQVAQWIHELTGVPLEVTQEKGSTRVEHSQADLTLLERWTHWRPERGLREGIAQTLEAIPGSPPAPSQAPRILLTSIGRKIPMIHQLKADAHRFHPQAVVVGCDCDPQPLARGAVDVFLQVPPMEQWPAEAMLDWCRQEQITHILPSREGDLLALAPWRERFGAEGIHLMISPETTIQKVTDKALFAAFALEHGLPVIPTYVRETLPEVPMGLRDRSWLIKPRQGAGGRGHRQFDTYHDLPRGEETKELVFQPVICGKEWTVDLYVDRTGTLQGCVSRQRQRIEEGEAKETVVRPHERLHELAKRLVAVFPFYGAALFQCIEDEEGHFWLLECNARFGGASTASVHAGLDSFFWFLSETQGRNLQSFYRPEPTLRLTQKRIPWDEVTYDS
jgi:carbamoyl-phosphate synthase large subunit